MLDAPAGHLSLLIVTDTTTLTVSLPARGEIVVGRGAEADVRVDDPQLSRRHAILLLGGATMLRESREPERHERRRQAAAQARGGSARPRRHNRDRWVGPHAPVDGDERASAPRLGAGYFEARLEEECARAESERRQLRDHACPDHRRRRDRGARERARRLPPPVGHRRRVRPSRARGAASRRRPRTRR